VQHPHQQALRRAQQRLLMRVLHEAPNGGDPALLVTALIDKLRVGARNAAPSDLEHAVLDVWALSEAASGEEA